MLNATQVSIPAACHAIHWRSVVRKPHWVRSSIRPYRSANGTKREGGIAPRSGSSQRTSASSRLSDPFASEIFG